MPIRLLQLQNAAERRLALVKEPRLKLLSVASIYTLLESHFKTNTPVLALLSAAATDTFLDYDPICAGHSNWKILPPIDHPEPSRLIVSGTGLTHLGSAKNRDAMHGTGKLEEGSRKLEGKTTHREPGGEDSMTDSMKMHRWGIERGRPAAGEIGVSPEWFYKGTGVSLRGHGEPLEWPGHGEDGGEEAEIAGVYIIDPAGNPVRIGMAQGNEFSDHVFEKKNYLNLAGSKLRTASLGPELVIDPDFSRVAGRVRILRRGADGGEESVWTKEIATGEAEMCHSLSNIEHHHFKFAGHRRPGDMHVHFYGACALSFGEGVRLQDGDVMEVHFGGFGRPLRNPLRVDKTPQTLVSVRPLR